MRLYLKFDFKESRIEYKVKGTQNVEYHRNNRCIGSYCADP